MCWAGRRPPPSSRSSSGACPSSRPDAPARHSRPDLVDERGVVPMTSNLITHIRHVDIAVPDYDAQVEFYGTLWGLTEVGGETGLRYFAAEGSPEQYIV